MRPEVHILQMTWRREEKAYSWWCSQMLFLTFSGREQLCRDTCRFKVGEKVTTLFAGQECF